MNKLLNSVLIEGYVESIVEERHVILMDGLEREVVLMRTENEIYGEQINFKYKIAIYTRSDLDPATEPIAVDQKIRVVGMLDVVDSIPTIHATNVEKLRY